MQSCYATYGTVPTSVQDPDLCKIRKFLGHPDLLVRNTDSDPDPSFHHQAIIVRKTLIYTLLHVPSKSNKQQHIGKKIIFCWRLEGHWRNEQAPELDPDLFVRGMDQGI